MSKTPRTDEHLRMKEENGHAVIVSRDFARQLETELVEARAVTEHWKKRAETAEAKLDWLMVQGIRGIAPGWVGIPEAEWDSIYPPNAGAQAPSEAR